jgi:hypothetical protein
MPPALLRVLLLLALLAPPAVAEPLRVIQEVDHDGASGAPFPPGAGVRLEVAPGAPAALRWPGGRQERIDPSRVSFAADASGAPRTIALDAQNGELLVLRRAGAAVVAEKRRVRELARVDARGLALDAVNDRLFVLAADRILVLDGVEQGRPGVSWLELPGQLPALAGLAFDPTNGHLFALAPEPGELLELGANGRLLAVHFLPERADGARAIAIAPSSDGTDAPDRHSLFVAVETEGGGSTFELSVEPLVLAAAPTVGVSLLQTVLTSNFSPPSPDPSGLELLGTNGPLLSSDGEVDEMTIYRNVNMFDVSLTGSLTGTGDTTFFSDEPTGVARNPANGRIFVSDDDDRRVYEVTPGSDNRVNSGDAVRSFPVATGVDAEGLAYGLGSIWLADGVNAEVWRYQPGGNGVFDGGGDDVITHFDTQSAGLTDPEGIAFDTDGSALYVVGEPENRVGHFSTSGTLLRWLDTSAANPDAPAGLAYGPGPAGDPTRRLYMVMRGVDNDSNPNENDGKLFTFAVTPLTGDNQPPSVFAGPDLATDISTPLALDADVSDDGQPNPPATVSVTWSKTSGPGTVSFGNANAVDTTASFSSTGSYVLRLTATDSELSAFDEVAVTVGESGGQTTIERRVAAGSDDAEQSPTGSVSLTSSDLELVTDGTAVQTVGLRFASVPIPQGAPIQAAWIQFQTDEVSSDATSLTIQGEASDNAATFASGSNNVGARPRTSAAVAWAPPAWNVVGEAGAAQRTSDLSPVVQQIVSRGGWVGGNAMAFIVTGSGRRVAEAYEGSVAGAPLLHVVFGGSATPVNATPTVSAGPDRLLLLGQAASLDGTASDDGLPNPPGALTTTWSRVSGPGTVSFGNANAIDTTATFSAAGSYVLRLTASDSALSAFDDMSVTVVDPNGSGTVEQRISVGSDDAEQRVSTGSVSLTGNDLELAVDGTRAQVVGLRFPNLVIPPGANIRTAWIQFRADEVKTGAASLTIRAEANPDPGTFAASSFNVSNRPLGGASVAWTPLAWSLVGETGAAQRTPELKDLVQEAVSRAGFGLGNPIVFVISGTGTRTAESFEGTASGAPLLHVEYGP